MQNMRIRDSDNYRNVIQNMWIYHIDSLPDDSVPEINHHHQFEWLAE